uniref:Uncharacterized protein n=1 Tax=Pseudomonas phage Nican01 TaxID=3138540 RepID=A0AAU6W119_9CAUD
MTDTNPNTEYRVVKRDVIPNAPWFMLYGGESADGMGAGVFVARTVFPSTALTHYRKCIKNNPYSTGCVQAVFPDRVERVDEKWLQREEVKQHKLRYPKPEKKATPKPQNYGTFA